MDQQSFTAVGCCCKWVGFRGLFAGTSEKWFQFRSSLQVLAVRETVRATDLALTRGVKQHGPGSTLT